MNKRLFILLGGLCLIAVIAGAGIWYLQKHSLQESKPNQQQAEIDFFDIGQGDSIYLRTTTNQDVLIDGGPSSEVLQQLGRAMPLFDTQIEVVLISHAHADHIAGIIAACNRYSFKQIVWAPQQLTSNVNTALHECVEHQQRDNGAEVLTPIAGDVITLNEHERLRVLHPFAQDAAVAANTNENDYSVVVEYENTINPADVTNILFTGDLGEVGERAMIAAKELGDIDVLKVGHHGSRTSTTAELLTAITPEYAVIQLGADNTFGHPNEETMQRLVDVMPQDHIFRNDLSGTIHMLITSSGYTIAPKAVGNFLDY